MSREDGTFDAARRTELKEYAKMAGYQGKFLVEYIEALEEIARAANAVQVTIDTAIGLSQQEKDAGKHMFESLARVWWMNDERQG